VTAMVQVGVWIGALDLPRHGRMLRHTVADDARRYNYPDAVGGQWAYSRCGDPAYWYVDGSAGARRLPDCPGCANRAVDREG
jgi:hypothetical protein